eukprot:5224596-Pleurochrysis_carterae.AAC.1
MQPSFRQPHARADSRAPPAQAPRPPPRISTARGSHAAAATGASSRPDRHLDTHLTISKVGTVKTSPMVDKTRASVAEKDAS